MGKQSKMYDTSHEERTHYRMQVVYSKETRERQLFMHDLKLLRKQVDKELFKELRRRIGPRWYQVLSEQQRTALDDLHVSIYQDVLEGRPVRVARIIHVLGISPRPKYGDLMSCEYLWHNDAKEMLAQLFICLYGHPVEIKRSSYNLNARIIMSSILYLGLNQLFEMLKERFRPDTTKEVITAKVRVKPEPAPISPYLQKLDAALYLPNRPKPFQPSPLPNLEALNEPFEDVAPTIITRPPPLPPPPPPPKKRLPRAYCDKLAGVINIEPHTSYTAISMKAVKRTVNQSRHRGSKSSVTEVKRTLGVDITATKKRIRKPVAPSTGLPNIQYVINGVYVINGRHYYVLGNVSILPAQGELIHGGHKYMNGDFVNIHCGIRGHLPPPAPDKCDCLERWNNEVFDYIRATKCFCGHYYDYGNEGTFPTENVPFFHKPTKNKPFQFDFATIFDTDHKSILVNKEFKRIWETESMLRVDDGTFSPKKKLKRSSVDCLGAHPKPEDYLKCALRLMRKLNLAARLPDVHLVPELKEWMRRRIYGPFNASQKTEMLRKSELYWAMVATLSKKVFGHVTPPKDPRFLGHSNWRHKQSLNDQFRKFTEEYKLQLFRAQAKMNNLLWPTMYQAEQPDKKFREIYFSYLCSRLEDLTMMRPYTTQEALDRALVMEQRQYCCPPVAEDDMPDK